ncbi:MAG: PDZ domain-containing protein, partial [Nitrospira sp.]
MISEVNESGPSHAAGINRGDVVIGFNDKDIQSVSQLRNMVARTLVGTTARVKVLRDGKEQVIAVKIGERPLDEVLAKREPSGSAAPGQSDTEKPPDNVLAALKTQMLDAALRSQLNVPAKTNGVAVQHVEAGSAAEAAGVQRGDIVQEVNRETVKSLEEY